MAALPTTKSLVHLQEDLFINSTLPIKDIFQATVTITTPSQGAANTAAVVTSTTAATGSFSTAAVGDLVLGVAPTSALPANQTLSGAHVSATGTLSFAFNSTGSTTGASRTFNVIIADLT